jgi:NAD(P)-dependent dehydrogenase (short-subunit alcohol dehydrogenase family)
VIDRTVLITGATGGIGRETARALAKMGANVVIGARDPTRGRATVDEIARSGGKAEFLAIDLASFASVRSAADRFVAAHPVLDVLVNNAAIVVRTRRVTEDGHELQWQVNFLSAFLLTNLLLDRLRAAAKPRVVNVSSDAYRVGRLQWDDLEMERGRYSGFRAYANTKLALVLFTRELARREPRVIATALHPGTAATEIWRSSPKALQAILRLVLPRPKTAARLVVRLASATDLAGTSGRYFDKSRESEPAPAARSDADAVRLWEAAAAATA